MISLLYEPAGADVAESEFLTRFPTFDNCRIVRDSA